MQSLIPISVCSYLVIINLVAIWQTIRDKRAARNGLWRVKEKTLIIISCLGGSIAMLITMLNIRHKTKHAKFMVGIPIIIILQIASLIFIWYMLSNGLQFI